MDISGEPQYLERMQLVYSKPAEDKGVYVVGACGFDSIPADLGTSFLQEIFPGVCVFLACPCHAGWREWQ